MWKNFEGIPWCALLSLVFCSFGSSLICNVMFNLTLWAMRGGCSMSSRCLLKFLSTQCRVVSGCSCPNGTDVFVILPCCLVGAQRCQRAEWLSAPSKFDCLNWMLAAGCFVLKYGMITGVATQSVSWANWRGCSPHHNSDAQIGFLIFGCLSLATLSLRVILLGSCLDTACEWTQLHLHILTCVFSFPFDSSLTCFQNINDNVGHRTCFRLL